MESMAHPPNSCDSRLRVKSGDFSETSLRTLTASAMTSGPVVKSQSTRFQRCSSDHTNSVAWKDDYSKSTCKRLDLVKDLTDQLTICCGTWIRLYFTRDHRDNHKPYCDGKIHTRAAMQKTGTRCWSPAFSFASEGPCRNLSYCSSSLGGT